MDSHIYGKSDKNKYFSKTKPPLLYTPAIYANIALSQRRKGWRLAPVKGVMP